MCVCVCAHCYEYLFITSSAFRVSYGSYFPLNAQREALVAHGLTGKVNPSYNWLHTVFFVQKLSCVKVRRNLQANGREKQQGEWLRLGSMKNEG